MKRIAEEDKIIIRPDKPYAIEEKDEGMMGPEGPPIYPDGL